MEYKLSCASFILALYFQRLLLKQVSFTFNISFFFFF